MSKNISNKNRIIVILCVTIIVMCFGFIILSMKLDNVLNEESVFDVKFSSVRKITSIKGGIEEPKGQVTIDKTGKILYVDFDLLEEHDEIDYEITIKNEGNIGASIIQLFSNYNYSLNDEKLNPIAINLSDISGKLLDPGEETTIKLSVTYDAGNMLGEQKVKGRIGIIAESN